MKLSPRLQSIADFVNRDSVVADIGTDHGYIPAYLVENGICSKIIASDINRGPLNNAQDYINKKKLTSNIETRLGNGLDILKPNEVDTVIIAGMGGILIEEILKNAPNITNNIETFILQPMVASYDLRKYLYANNFIIEDEVLCKEGDKIYEIIYSKRGKELIEDDIYFEIGRKLIEKKDKHLKEFLKKKIKKNNNILNKLKNKNSDKSIKRYKQVTNINEKIKAVYSSL
ncbi:tRNA (adenine(22)-N(1))-methyltransferase [Dethiothermospora halolimnae]|uniref:tRNA (adenine(22)-N(1))-methyltransferase n=1 Tax=Dethiothermospora halolimnae TaxID=3114390 RepID=UPI003CCBE24E